MQGNRKLWPGEKLGNRNKLRNAIDDEINMYIKYFCIKTGIITICSGIKGKERWIHFEEKWKI